MAASRDQGGALPALRPSLRLLLLGAFMACPLRATPARAWFRRPRTCEERGQAGGHGARGVRSAMGRPRIWQHADCSRGCGQDRPVLVPLETGPHTPGCRGPRHRRASVPSDGSADEAFSLSRPVPGQSCPASPLMSPQDSPAHPGTCLRRFCAKTLMGSRWTCGRAVSTGSFTGCERPLETWRLSPCSPQHRVRLLSLRDC